MKDTNLESHTQWLEHCLRIYVYLHLQFIDICGDCHIFSCALWDTPLEFQYSSEVSIPKHMFKILIYVARFFSVIKYPHDKPAMAKCIHLEYFYMKFNKGHGKVHCQLETN